MATAKHVLPFRRKREGRTNYKKRLALLKSGQPRLVIRKSNRHLQLQLVRYEPDGDKVLITINTRMLLKHGWTHSTKSTPAAYLAGILFGQAAKAQKISDAIADIGLQKHRSGTRICAALKGVNDGGLVVPAGQEIYPQADRLLGKHLKIEKDVVVLLKKLGVEPPVSEKGAATEAPAATAAKME